jgi:hypothetical protein
VKRGIVQILYDRAFTNCQEQRDFITEVMKNTIYGKIATKTLCGHYNKKISKEKLSKQ